MSQNPITSFRQPKLCHVIIPTGVISESEIKVAFAVGRPAVYRLVAAELPKSKSSSKVQIGIPNSRFDLVSTSFESLRSGEKKKQECGNYNTSIRLVCNSKYPLVSVPVTGNRTHAVVYIKIKLEFGL